MTPRAGRRAGTAVLAVALVAVGGVLWARNADDQDGLVAGDGRSDPALPAVRRPAFAIGAPVRLRRFRDDTVWAPVRVDQTVRAAPRAAAAAVATLPRLTPEGTVNLAAVLRRRRSSSQTWLQVRVSSLPNGAIGWIPRRGLGGYRVARGRLVVDRASLTARLMRGGRAIFSAPVGVGRPQWPTPPGNFLVRNRLTRFRSSFYGPVAFGTSARSETLTDWPAGGFVGIHGTSRPDLIPGRVSHGCIRMRNEDILRLERILTVGTPVTIL